MTRRPDLDKLAAALGGLPVLGCRAGSPAARQGVRYGDVILAVNGVPTPDWAAFVEGRSLSSTTMSLDLFRDGAQLHVDVALDAAPALSPMHILTDLIAERVVPLDAAFLAPPASKPN